MQESRNAEKKECTRRTGIERVNGLERREEREECELNGGKAFMFNFPLRFGVVLGCLISLRGTSKGGYAHAPPVPVNHPRFIRNKPWMRIIHYSSILCFIIRYEYLLFIYLL